MKNQRIVIFCGPDRCGKTEISRALSRVTCVPTFKASSEHDTFLNKQDLFLNQLRFADTRMVDFLAQTGHSVIFDRAYPCEFAYSALYGRKTDTDVLRYVDTRFADLKAKVVVCFRSSYEGIVDDIQPLLGGQQLAYVEREYRRFARWTKCETMFLNVDDEDLIREVKECIDFIGYPRHEVDAMLSHLRAITPSKQT